MLLRVVGGELRGLQLRVPKSPRLRPTSEKVREAIFDVLGDLVSGARVLDLYAGSGALGIEALSRGAMTVEFVESWGAACQIIRTNVATAGIQQRTRLWCRSVTSTIGQLDGTFGLVLADPPYDDQTIDTLLATVGEGRVLELGGTFVLEHSARKAPRETYGHLYRNQHKRYGDTEVSFYSLLEDSV